MMVPLTRRVYFCALVATHLQSLSNQHPTSCWSRSTPMCPSYHPDLRPCIKLCQASPQLLLSRPQLQSQVISLHSNEVKFSLSHSIICCYFGYLFLSLLWWIKLFDAQFATISWMRKTVESLLLRTIRQTTRITLAALGSSGLRLERRSNCSLILSTLNFAAIPFRYKNIFKCCYIR